MSHAFKTGVAFLVHKYLGPLSSFRRAPANVFYIHGGVIILKSVRFNFRRALIVYRVAAPPWKVLEARRAFNPRRGGHCAAEWRERR